jgi:hypothetical protein
MNREVHNYSTKNNFDFHLPNVNLVKYQNGVYYVGIKLYNHLPTDIKNLVRDQKLFEFALRRFLRFSSFIHWRSFITLR